MNNSEKYEISQGYAALFNGITKALEDLKLLSAELRTVQQIAEENYIERFESRERHTLNI